MANNVSNYLEIKGTDEVIDAMDALFDLARGEKYMDILGFCKAFYTDVETDESGTAVMYSWTLDNVGAKWIYVEDCIDTGRWNIQSANYTPKEFWIRLYELARAIDPNVVIEVKFEDESLEPVGALVIKDHDGVGDMHIREEYDLEDPTIDMDWDDEDYDEKQMEFMEEKDELIDSLLELCHSVIDGDDGETVWGNEEE